MKALKQSAMDALAEASRGQPQRLNEVPLGRRLAERRAAAEFKAKQGKGE
jgi:hypothetical protein